MHTQCLPCDIVFKRKTFSLTHCLTTHECHLYDRCWNFLSLAYGFTRILEVLENSALAQSSACSRPNSRRRRIVAWKGVWAGWDLAGCRSEVGTQTTRLILRPRRKRKVAGPGLIGSNPRATMSLASNRGWEDGDHRGWEDGDHWGWGHSLQNFWYLFIQPHSLAPFFHCTMLLSLVHTIFDVRWDSVQHFSCLPQTG
jgi:hypothetical protein